MSLSPGPVELPPCLDLERARALLGGELPGDAMHRATLHLLTACRRCSRALSLAFRRERRRARTAGPSAGAAPRRAGCEEEREARHRQEVVFRVLRGLGLTPFELERGAPFDLPPLLRLEAHLLRSWEARYGDPAEMLDQARRAVALSDSVLTGADCGGEPQLSDLRGRAHTAAANALRIQGRHAESAAHLDRAFVYLARGTGDGRLLAEVLPIDAGLSADRRDFAAAQRTLDRAVSLCRRHHLGRRLAQVLIQKGTYFGYAGELPAAISWLEQGIAALDPRADAELALSARFNLASYLVDAGEPREARRHAWGLAARFAAGGQKLNSLRVRWLEAKIHAALGQDDRAARDYRAARDGFAETEDPFDAGLVTLELALLLHRQGQRQEAAHHAGQAAALFTRLGVGREALGSLTLLEQLLGEGRATAERLATLVEAIERDARATLADGPRPAPVAGTAAATSAP